ncbi:FAD-dependent monooxygenase [Aureispira sp. CCB-QB1]|uniref:FAD-dependent monooxygenase n=1 Tax=Aureispira sp. CCB-QB1 TaxID=1313421 RepID=UPI0006974384|nr:FAD-dependent monooxygenase [Aureispira sp. CCB-QB1]
MKTSNIPVLIIGAGPTGLMAAAQLQRFGIPYRIIEKRKGTTTFSKALAVQARTMEIYEQMNIADQALELGIPAQRAEIMVKGQDVQTLPLSETGADFTPFPYVFVLEQSCNEALLLEYIEKKGGQVEFNTEMTSFQIQGNGAQVEITTADGTQEQINADWVIAADGGRSPVRHALNIPFKGDTYKNIFYVVDTSVFWQKDHNAIHINLADNNFTGFFPITDEDGTRYRLVGILPESYSEQENIQFEDISSYIKDIQHLDIEFGEANWFSVYKVHHRCIDRFKEGPVFFAGDAAHVHSPAGGQGMNTGLQDAYNLAWKLALVVQGKAKQTLLDSYHNERWPIANQLVNSTDRAFSSVVKKGSLINWFRLTIAPVLIGRLMGIKAIQQRAFKIVSQVGINYPDSLVSNSSIYLNKKTPHPGDRLPYLEILDEKTGKLKSLYQQLGEQTFHAIIWLSNKDKIQDKDAYAVKTFLDNNYANLFQTHIIYDQTENVPAFQTLHLNHSTLYLIRPDNYIGYIGKVDDLTALEDYLQLFLVR